MTRHQEDDEESVCVCAVLCLSGHQSTVGCMNSTEFDPIEQPYRWSHAHTQLTFPGDQRASQLHSINEDRGRRDTI